jgi:ribosomal protein S18 acetylase RimI-like enzyme
MLIRKATARDVPALVRIVHGERSVEDYAGEYSSAVFRAMLRRGAIVYVVELEGEPVGFLEVERDAERKGLYLRTIAVAKEWRGKGVGSALFDLFERLAKRFKVSHTMFLVREWNRPMRALAKKRGYRTADRLLLFTKKRR